MKKIILIAGLVLSAVSIISSCKKEDVNIEETSVNTHPDLNKFNITKDVSLSVKNQISILKNQSNDKSYSLVDITTNFIDSLNFDFSNLGNLDKVSLNDSELDKGDYAVTLVQKNQNSADVNQTILCLYVSNDTIVDASIIKSIVNDSITYATYFRTSGELFKTMQINNVTGELNETTDFLVSKADYGTGKGKGKTYGQKVQDCITATYSNNGWVSVWANLQTAVLPQTLVAITLACVVKNS